MAGAKGTSSSSMAAVVMPDAPDSTELTSSARRSAVSPLAAPNSDLRTKPRPAEVAWRASTAPPTRGSTPFFAPFDPRELVGLQAGSYRLERVIGNGGLACVYAARHPTIGTSVAVKVLHPHVASSPDSVRRFIREARASAEIRSSFIPRYYDFGQLPDGRAYAVMELLEGETIDERIARNKSFSLEETAMWLIQIAQALGEAHARGIIHRDIKPDNLFIARDAQGNESIRVLDFGIAMIVNDQHDRLTQSGLFVGTPVYCPPEQMFGEVVTVSADIYALAVTAYQMLSGSLPFQGQMADLFQAKTRREPPSIRTLCPDLPLTVDKTLKRALSRRPEKRFGSTLEFEQAVRQWIPAVGAEDDRRGRRMQFVMLATLLVVLSCSVAFWMRSQQTVPSARAPEVPPAMVRTAPETAPLLRSSLRSDTSGSLEAAEDSPTRELESAK